MSTVLSSGQRSRILSVFYIFCYASDVREKRLGWRGKLRRGGGVMKGRSLRGWAEGDQKQARTELLSVFFEAEADK
jgi:hypothetical protein